MSTGIKPCPFCGSSEIDIESVEIEGYDLGYQASCSQCSVMGSTYATKEDAIAVWNTRAPVFVVTEDSGMMDGDQILGIFSSAANARNRVLERFAEIDPSDRRTTIEAFANELDGGFGQAAWSERSMTASRYSQEIHDNLGGK